MMRLVKFTKTGDYNLLIFNIFVYILSKKKKYICLYLESLPFKFEKYCGKKKRMGDVTY